MPIKVPTTSSRPDWLQNAPTGHLTLQLLTGVTAAQTCMKYPIASYYLYIPTTHPLSRQKSGQLPNQQFSHLFPVVVVVHGSGRDAAQERDRWAGFAEKHGCVVVAPLFPVDLRSLEGVDNYKRLVYQPESKEKPMFFDEIMLQILQEVSDIWGQVDIDQFSLVGFSGGGQFAHRFFYLHPDRLKSVSIGAPGNVTFLDDSSPWPHGISDVAQRFPGIRVDVERLRAVKVQLFVGSADLFHTINYDGSRAALSRFGVSEKLHRSFISLDIEHRFDIQPGVEHQGHLLLHLVQPFVLENLYLSDYS